MWTNVVVEPGNMAAASVGAEAILATKSSSATWGESCNKDVEVAVEYNRLDVLFHQQSLVEVPYPLPVKSNDQTRSTPCRPSIQASLSRPAPLLTTRREFELDDPEARIKCDYHQILTTHGTYSSTTLIANCAKVLDRRQIDPSFQRLNRPHARLTNTN
jgi:hypothetical protein